MLWRVRQESRYKVLVLSRNGSHLAAFGMDLTPRVLATDTGREVWTPPAGIGSPGLHPRCLRLSADGQAVVFNARGGCVLFDITSGKEKLRIPLQGDTGPLMRKGTVLPALYTTDKGVKALRFVDLATGKKLSAVELPEPMSPAYASPEERYLFCLRPDRRMVACELLP